MAIKTLCFIDIIIPLFPAKKTLLLTNYEKFDIINIVLKIILEKALQASKSFPNIPKQEAKN